MSKKIAILGKLETKYHAPFDDPEIALAVSIEQAGLGSNVTPVARDIYEYYFVERYAAAEEQDENTLLR